MNPLNEKEIEKIVRLSDGRLSPQEIDDLEALLNADGELAEEYLEQKQVSALMKSVFEAEPMPVPVTQEVYWAGIAQKLNPTAAEKETSQNVPQKVELWRRLAHARRFWAPAMAASLVMGFLFFYESGQQGRQSSYGSSYNEVETSAGVSATTLESDTICIEWITYSNPLQDFTSET